MTTTELPKLPDDTAARIAEGTALLIRRVVDQPDGHDLAQALGLVGYHGWDSRGANGGGHKRRVWREPITTTIEPAQRPSADPYRHCHTRPRVLAVKL